MIYLLIIVFIIFIAFSYKYTWWKPAVDWKRPRVLMYHMVREHIDGAKFNKLRVTPAQFEQQVTLS